MLSYTDESCKGCFIDYLQYIMWYQCLICIVMEFRLFSWHDVSILVFFFVSTMLEYVYGMLIWLPYGLEMIYVCYKPVESVQNEFDLWDNRLSLMIINYLCVCVESCLENNRLSTMIINYPFICYKPKKLGMLNLFE